MHNQVPNVKTVMGVFRVKERNTDERERGGEPSIVGHMHSSQGAPSGREEVLERSVQGKTPTLLSSRALLWITRCIWESCVCDMFFWSSPD